MPPASCDRHQRHGRACEVRAVGAGLKLVANQLQNADDDVIDEVGHARINTPCEFCN